MRTNDQSRIYEALQNILQCCIVCLDVGSEHLAVMNKLQLNHDFNFFYGILIPCFYSCAY